MNDDIDLEAIKVIVGSSAGGMAGGLTGMAIGTSIAAAVAAPAVGLLALFALPAVGVILGSQSGVKNPAGAVLGFFGSFKQ
jgi:hypothetical protein